MPENTSFQGKGRHAKESSHQTIKKKKSKGQFPTRERELRRRYQHLEESLGGRRSGKRKENERRYRKRKSDMTNPGGTRGTAGPGIHLATKKNKEMKEAKGGIAGTTPGGMGLASKNREYRSIPRQGKKSTKVES